jgi:hypothetical protein
VADSCHTDPPSRLDQVDDPARLSANERVKERVREIQSIGAERAAVTVQSLIDEAEQARIKAMDAPNGAAAAVSAIAAKAKRPAFGAKRSTNTTLAPSARSGA